MRDDAWKSRRAGMTAALAAMALGLLAAGAAPAPADHWELAGQWHLDEGARPDDSAGSTPDSSGHGIDLLLRLVGDRAGRFQRAFATGNNSLLGLGTLEGDARLRPAQLTAILWVTDESPGPGPSRYVLASGGGDCVPSAYAMYTSFAGDVNAGGLYFYVNVGGTAVHAPGVPPSAVWDGEWHMLAGTCYGDTVRFYLDGTRSAAARRPRGRSTTRTRTWRCGSPTTPARAPGPR